ncbi:MAG TPA: hypothetical protein VFQ61_22485 [Polyangiaceae bacterium]|nr:hypothetical protein [Polyangiaceae bacterium]
MTTKPDSQGQNRAAVACLNDPFPNPGASSQHAERTASAGTDALLFASDDDEPTLSDVITPLPGTLRQVNPLEGLEGSEEPSDDPLGLDDAVTRVTSIGAELAKAAELEQPPSREALPRPALERDVVETTHVRPAAEAKPRTPPPKPERRSGTSASRRITPRIDLRELREQTKSEVGPEPAKSEPARQESRSEPKSSRFKTPPPPKPLRALESRRQSDSESRMAAASSSSASGAFRLENGQIVSSVPATPSSAPGNPSAGSPDVQRSHLAVVSGAVVNNNDRVEERPSSRNRSSRPAPDFELSTPDRPFNPYRLSTFVLPEGLRGQLNALEPPSLSDADFEDRETTPPPAPREPSEITQVAPWAEATTPAAADALMGRQVTPPALPVQPESRPPASSLNSPSVQPFTYPSVPAGSSSLLITTPSANRSNPANVAHREARARRFVGLAAAAFGLSLLGFGAVTYLQSTDWLSDNGSQGSGSHELGDAPAEPLLEAGNAAPESELRVLAASPAAPAAAVKEAKPADTPREPAASSSAKAPIEERASAPAPERVAAPAASPSVAIISKPPPLAAAGGWQVQSAGSTKPKAPVVVSAVAPATKAAPLAAVPPTKTAALPAKPKTEPVQVLPAKPAAKPIAPREKAPTVAAASPSKGRSKSSVFDTMMAPPEE